MSKGLGLDPGSTIIFGSGSIGPAEKAENLHIGCREHSDY